MIGKDGTILQNRSLSERTYHTKSSRINDSSIAIVLAGNFNNEQPTVQQLAQLSRLIKRLQAIYDIKRVIPHVEASATQCAGEFLNEWLASNFQENEYKLFKISRYYTVVPNQTQYYLGRTYEEDFKINCQNDCFKTANGTDLRYVEPFTSVACPSNMPTGTRLEIVGIGEVTCNDRGGAIVTEEQCRERGWTNCRDRLDLWTGIGDQGLINLYTGFQGGDYLVKKL